LRPRCAITPPGSAFVSLKGGLAELVEALASRLPKAAVKTGRPVRGLRIEGVLGRPSTNRHDVRLVLAEQAPGRYEAQSAPLREGNWIITLEA